MSAYYNEIDPYCAQWLRNLIAAGHIATGDVDERSVEDVTPNDVRGYTQCHYFAGIGVWSYALRLAGWPDDRPVWTGSCPCQPFSQAGKGAGFADERHLWPAWFHLIRECRPPIVFGEQASAAIRHGWIDLVSADMENEGYSFGFSVFGAHSVGAPHKRQRVYFMADTDSEPGERRAGGISRTQEAECCARIENGHISDGPTDGCEAGDVVGNAYGEGCPRSSQRLLGQRNPWREYDLIPCRDGKSRPVEPGTFPLVERPAASVGRLRAYGNAIVPQAAAAFIRSKLT